MFRHKDHHPSIRAVVVNVADEDQLAALAAFTKTEEKDWVLDRHTHKHFMFAMKACNGEQPVIFGIQYRGSANGLYFFDKSGLLDNASLRVGNPTPDANRVRPAKVCVVKMSGHSLYVFTERAGLGPADVISIAITSVDPSLRGRVEEMMSPSDVVYKPDVPKDFELLLSGKDVLFILDSNGQFVETGDFVREVGEYLPEEADVAGSDEDEPAHVPEENEVFGNLARVPEDDEEFSGVKPNGK